MPLYLARNCEQISTGICFDNGSSENGQTGGGWVQSKEGTCICVFQSNRMKHVYVSLINSTIVNDQQTTVWQSSRYVHML
jgi:hypothetical protein